MPRRAHSFSTGTVGTSGLRAAGRRPGLRQPLGRRPSLRVAAVLSGRVHGARDVLALVVGATRRIKLGTGILVLPLRDPVVTAKTFANLDVASGGRLIFGVGVGWDEREFAACQVPKETRGQRMDEMLTIITGLWTEERVSYEGRFFRLSEVPLLPKPVQRPHPPIWIAGGTVPQGTSRHITRSRGYTAAAAMKRAGRVADGFMTAYRACPGLDMSCLEES